MIVRTHLLRSRPSSSGMQSPTSSSHYRAAMSAAGSHSRPKKLSVRPDRSPGARRTHTPWGAVTGVVNGSKRDETPLEVACEQWQSLKMDCTAPPVTNNLAYGPSHQGSCFVLLHPLGLRSPIYPSGYSTSSRRRRAGHPRERVRRAWPRCLASGGNNVYVRPIWRSTGARAEAGASAQHGRRRRNQTGGRHAPSNRFKLRTRLILPCAARPNAPRFFAARCTKIRQRRSSAHVELLERH